MVDLDAIAASLTEIEKGFWVAQGDEEVSYPAGTHAILADLEDDSFWFSHRGEVVTSTVERYPPAGCLFDVGGGNGYMVRELRSRGFDAILIEPGADGARAALARGLAPVINATVGTARLKRESLPAVGLFDVLEHVRHDRRFLAELREALVPGGRIYLTVPAYKFLWSAEDIRAGHYRRYGVNSLRRILTASGFEVEFQSHFFGLLPIPIFLFRTIPSALGLRKPSVPNANEHGGKSALLRSVADLTLRWERRILSRLTLPFGSSLIVVAKKPT